MNSYQQAHAALGLADVALIKKALGPVGALAENLAPVVAEAAPVAAKGGGALAKVLTALGLGTAVGGTGMYFGKDKLADLVKNLTATETPQPAAQGSGGISPWLVGGAGALGLGGLGAAAMYADSQKDKEQEDADKLLLSDLMAAR